MEEAARRHTLPQNANPRRFPSSSTEGIPWDRRASPSRMLEKYGHARSGNMDCRQPRTALLKPSSENLLAFEWYQHDVGWLIAMHVLGSLELLDTSPDLLRIPRFLEMRLSVSILLILNPGP